MEAYKSSELSESEDERLEDSDTGPDWLPDSSDSRKKRTLAPESKEPKENYARNLSTQWHDVNKNASEKPQPVWYCSLEEPQPSQSPIDYFQNFWSGKLIEHIVDQSNPYSIQRDPNKPLTMNVKELEKFVGQIMPVPNLPDLGANSNFVLRLTQMIPEHKNILVYFDKWFASPRLFVTLAKKGVGVLGTVRLNRSRCLTFTADAEMKKRGRETFEGKETTLDRIDIRAVKWFDNRAVILVSSSEYAEPVGTVTRYDSKSHREIEIPCPRIVPAYNQFIRGVDLLDSLIAHYRIKTRSKKLYLRFSFTLWIW
ncbi:hypothetical protein PR048_028908 [Dryococelus australis]|uniref:PiggyBac transposable element-derived protein domain-containing protein n=1 Tax=Dryococelus australis TaxID=614101 RepID=A0ABQ9GBW3_9NEOP|nr:hypothetical protein PR048_028908 [Dryococelus australis]